METLFAALTAFGILTWIGILCWILILAAKDPSETPRRWRWRF